MECIQFTSRTGLVMEVMVTEVQKLLSQGGDKEILPESCCFIKRLKISYVFETY